MFKKCRGPPPCLVKLGKYEINGAIDDLTSFWRLLYYHLLEGQKFANLKSAARSVAQCTMQNKCVFAKYCPVFTLFSL
jgi:hypothetical protein